MVLKFVLLFVIVSACFYDQVTGAEGGHETAAPTHEAPTTGTEGGHEEAGGHETAAPTAGGHEAPAHGTAEGSGHGEEEHECEEHGGGGEVGLLSLMNHFHDDTAIIWIIVGLLIIVNFVWELITDGLEHYFTESRREHIVVMLEKLYKELTIVGLWSVVIFLISSIAGDAEGFEDTKHVFELIHISLFGLVLIFVGVMIFIAALSVIIFWRWRKLEITIDPEITKEEYAKLEEYKRTTSIVVRFFSYCVRPVAFFRSRLTEARHNYIVLKQRFLEHVNHLKVDEEEFRFDKYLKRAMRFTFIELSQVHWSVLAAVLIGILAIWMAFALTTPHHLGIPYTIISIFCFLACVLLHWKIIFVYESLIEDRNFLSKTKIPVWHRAPKIAPAVNHYANKRDRKKKDKSNTLSEVPQRVCHYFIGIVPSPNPEKDELHRTEKEVNAHSIYHHHHQSDIVWMLRIWKFIRCHYTKQELSNFHSSTEHQKLFWLGSNFLFLYLLQVTIFWQACLVAIIIGSLAQVIEMSYFYQIFPILSTILNLFYFFPLIIYRYAYVTNVGEFTKPEIVEEQYFLKEVVEEDVIPRGRAPTYV